MDTVFGALSSAHPNSHACQFERCVPSQLSVTLNLLVGPCETLKRGPEDSYQEQHWAYLQSVLVKFKFFSSYTPMSKHVVGVDSPAFNRSEAMDEYLPLQRSRLVEHSLPVGLVWLWTLEVCLLGEWGASGGFLKFNWCPNCRTLYPKWRRDWEPWALAEMFPDHFPTCS